jgi:hypothetical protein
LQARRIGAARSFCASEPDLVYLDGQQAVLYRSKLSPFPGRNFEAMDPLEGLARMSDHIPDPGPHRTLFYGEYANRVRGERQHYANGVRGERPSEKLGHQKHEEEQLKKRRCSPSWARLIAKVFQTDPLVCRRCGGPLRVVAYITNTVAIRRILDHLGLSPPGEPPPELREVLRVPVDDQGREIGAGPA